MATLYMIHKYPTKITNNNQTIVYNQRNFNNVPIHNILEWCNTVWYTIKYKDVILINKQTNTNKLILVIPRTEDFYLVCNQHFHEYISGIEDFEEWIKLISLASIIHYKKVLMLCNPLQFMKKTFHTILWWCVLQLCYRHRNKCNILISLHHLLKMCHLLHGV